jgi:hypothetical protein
MSRSHDTLRFGILGVGAAVVGLCLLSAAAGAQEFIDCPAPSAMPSGGPQATASHQMFNDVCFLDRFPPSGLPIVLFDDFSWRSFLALAWPAKVGQRGQPDSALALDGAADRSTVFETFKSEWEVFQKDGRDPIAWNEYGGLLPCDVPGLAAGDIVLAGFSKLENIVQSGGSGPLIAQNRTFVRYTSGFNETIFQHIVGGSFFRRAKLGDFTPTPSGSIRIKSAWIDMQGIERPERFHTRNAWLFDPATSRCEKKTVGLVGLHIVTKTPTHPQEIWSTFEHIDNVPGPHASRPYTFNNGDGSAMPTSNPVTCFDPASCPPPEPFNVERTKKIHDMGNFSTAKTNEKYQAMLAANFPNSPWRNYQLVMTQWPLKRSRPDLDGSPFNTFPGTGNPVIPGTPNDATAFANTTMETFRQETIDRNGCMGCHNAVKNYDFFFSLLVRAFPRN